MGRLAVVHFLPIEYYPPTTNMLDFLGEHYNGGISVFTTNNDKNRRAYDFGEKIKVHRTSFPRKEDNRVLRLIKYLNFNVKTVLRLVRINPDTVFYYESYSVGPVYWYFKLFGRNKRLAIHYHEYFDKSWYEEGMAMLKNYYNYEKRYLLSKASWVSQTNRKRLELFRTDHSVISDQVGRILPNYPPSSWFESASEKVSSGSLPIKFVYIGSLSLVDTYIEEFCNWVILQEGKVTFDIFSYNLHQDTKLFISNLNSEHITFFSDGVEYSEVPDVLSNYDVGVILYKANTKNYKWNAPNKLFEYLTCRLKVLYPEVMFGMHEYESDLVKSIDFNNIPTYGSLAKFLTSASDFTLKYTAEVVNSTFLDYLNNGELVENQKTS